MKYLEKSLRIILHDLLIRFYHRSVQNVSTEKIDLKNPVSFHKFILTCGREWNILKLTDLCGKKDGKS